MVMDYEWFILAVMRLTGINLALYKEGQMKRRIDTLIAGKGLSGYADYVDLLAHNPEVLSHFKDYITINVTEFFRTPDHWHTLEEHLFPYLHNPVVWSVACATGEEPYSLVMSLAEHMPLTEIHVIATDINERVLQKARQGEYTAQAVAAVPQHYLDRYFIQTDHVYRVSDAVRACVEFRQLDILSDPHPTQCDLIVCRNVLIYFTDEAKNQLYHSFFNSLKPGGHLFTGNTEQLIRYQEQGFTKKTGYLYCRPLPEK